MIHLDLTLCLDEPDIWIRRAKKSDVSPYYWYVLMYANDTLVISDNTEAKLRNDICR